MLHRRITSTLLAIKNKQIHKIQNTFFLCFQFDVRVRSNILNLFVEHGDVSWHLFPK